MYTFAYADVLEDSPKAGRELERDALDRSIEMLETASHAGLRSREAAEALAFVRRLWTYFIEDLGQPENELPVQLRADLISIGLWVLREADQLRLERTDNFAGLIAVSTSIRDGLE